MKISIVISIKNRTKLFRRSLKLYNKQTMLKKDWELIVVDDMSSEDILDTLKKYAGNLNFQYIRMDSNKNDFPVYWGPALSNNIGFKASEGEVIAITGPEMLMKEDALIHAYSSAMKNQTVYGHVLHSSRRFVNLMDRNPSMENNSFNQLFSLPSAKVQDITKETYYWFFCAVKREFIMQVNGCDEQFMKGICGDDDDFANRMNEFGVKKVHDFNIIGIHQDHTVEDKGDGKRVRRNSTWEMARIKNTRYLEDWHSKRNKESIVNKDRDWGSDKLIIKKEMNRI